MRTESEGLRRQVAALGRRTRGARLPEALYRTLRSTNPIETLNGGAARYTRNVKRWRGGSMIVRWVGAGVLWSERGFRRLRGYRAMANLIAALDRAFNHKSLDVHAKAA